MVAIKDSYGSLGVARRGVRKSPRPKRRDHPTHWRSEGKSVEEASWPRVASQASLLSDRPIVSTLG